MFMLRLTLALLLTLAGHSATSALALPSSSCVSSTDGLIESKSDAQAWAKAQASRHPDDTILYIRGFPYGCHIIEARERLDVLLPPLPEFKISAVAGGDKTPVGANGQSANADRDAFFAFTISKFVAPGSLVANKDFLSLKYSCFLTGDDRYPDRRLLGPFDQDAKCGENQPSNIGRFDVVMEGHYARFYELIYSCSHAFLNGIPTGSEPISGGMCGTDLSYNWLTAMTISVKRRPLE